MNDDEPHDLLGAYVLGGLDADERRQFEDHLRGCSRCRRDVADCAPLPALLAKVDPADLAADTTDGGSGNTRRWWVAGAALAGVGPPGRAGTAGAGRRGGAGPVGRAGRGRRAGLILSRWAAGRPGPSTALALVAPLRMT
jgi:anti-sigma factor RsiW